MLLFTGIERFAKTGIFIGDNRNIFVESLAKQFLEKHKLDNSNKIWQAFATLDQEVSSVIPKLPHVDCTQSFVKIIGSGIRPKVEKKLLSEVDEVFESLTTHLKNVHNSLEKSMVAEGYSCVDSDWQFGSQSLNPDLAFDLRDQFSNRFTEVYNLETSGLNSQFSKSFKRNVCLKFWHTKCKPTLMMTLPYIRALDQLIKSSIKLLNDSVFNKMQVNFGQDNLVSQTFIKLLTFIEHAVGLVLTD